MCSMLILNGSVQDVWGDMDYLKNLSKGEVEYIRRGAMPKVEMRKIHVEDGVLRVDTKLMAHEIKALDIHYQILESETMDTDEFLFSPKKMLYQ